MWYTLWVPEGVARRAGAVLARLRRGPVKSSNQRGPSWLRTLQSFQSGVQQAGPAAGASYSLIGAIVLFGGVGYAYDAWQGTSPNGVTTGLIIGLIVGFYLLAKAVWHR